MSLKLIGFLKVSKFFEISRSRSREVRKTIKLSGMGKTNKAQMDRAAGVDPKRIKEDATQTSDLQGFLDSPEDPYFFAVETEPDDEPAPQSTSPTKMKPTKSSAQSKTPANSPTEKNKVGRSHAQPGKRKQPVTDGQRGSQSCAQKGPVFSSQVQKKGKGGHSRAEAPGSGKTANGRSLRPTCSPAISEVKQGLEDAMGVPERPFVARKIRMCVGSGCNGTQT